jgi:hypothetical protein
MKILFTASGVLALFLLSGLAFAQASASEKPAVKMGLWREDVTTTITGINGVNPAPQKSSDLACISAESWKQHGLHAADDTHCEVVNLRWDAHRLTYETHCGGSSVSEFHIDITIDSDELMHGTATAEFPSGSTAPAGKLSSTLTAKYVSTACGDVKPGEKKTVKQ